MDSGDLSSDGKKKPTSGFFRSFKDRLSKGEQMLVSLINENVYSYILLSWVFGYSLAF